MFLLELAKMKTSPLLRRSHMALVTIPLSPLKLLRMSTGRLYSQYRHVPSKLNIAGGDDFPQVGRAHTALDAHGHAACGAHFYRHEAWAVLYFTGLAF